MKKKHPDGRNGNSCVTKYLLMMKFSVLFWLISFSVVAGESYSQVALVNINAKNTRIAKVFDQIEQQTEFYFFYNKNEFDDSRKVSMECNQKPLEQVMEDLLGESGMKYEIAGRYIYIVTPHDAEILAAKLEEVEVKGKVISCDDKQPLPGASIMVKGTSNGTVTNIDGEFTLKAPVGATLLVSFIGMSSKEVPVSAGELSVIELCADVMGLDEVIVVGYGTMKKSDLTGAVASVKGSDVNKVAAVNPTEALQGRIAGVSVTKIGGAPGAGVDIKIRGVGTFGNNQPLVVIDGIKGDLNYLNQDDIESFQVLKDGAAAAIYGSEAANGVILVTTKKGKKGEIQVDLSAYSSINQSINQLELLDADGYKKVHKAMYLNAGKSLPGYLADGYQNSNNTNWMDEISQTGIAQNYSLRVTGGNDVANFSLSGQFADEQGTLIGTGFTKSLMKARTGIKKGRLSLDGSLSYVESFTDNQKFSMRQAYLISPLIPVTDENQKYGYGLPDVDNGIPSHTNPVADNNFVENNNTNHYLISNIDAQIDLIGGLKYQFRGGLENSDEYYYNFYPPYQSNIKEPHLYPYLEENRSNLRQLIMENLIHFNKDINDHSIAAVAGYSTYQQDWENTGANVTGKTTKRSVDGEEIVEEEIPGGFLDYKFKTLNGGIGGTYSAYGTKGTYTRTSVLGRINYNYAGKYYFQATVRRDGSSKFGPNNRYGTFPSFALGWRISEEEFLQKDWVNNLKVRASYGVLGNEVSLSNYAWQPLITTINDYRLGYVRGNGRNPWPGSIAREMENPDYRWESTASTNIGVDFTLFTNISGVINYYHNNTEDLLITRLVAPSGGFISNPIANVGSVVNKGLEFELSYRQSEQDFQYGASLTFSTLKNEVTKLTNADQALAGTGLKYGTEHIPTQSKEGYPIGGFWLYDSNGLFQTDAEAEAYKNKAGERLQPKAKAGDVKFIDTNNDGVIDENDKIYMGSGLPTYEYGLNLDAAYKGFDITLFIQGVGGNKIYNGNRYDLEGMSAGMNFLASTEDFWSPENTGSNMPRPVLGDPNNNTRESDRFLEDGDYLRLKTLQVGYTLPTKLTSKIGVEKARFYATGQNLLTLTKYSGLDPEVGRSSVLNSGVDIALYPISRSFIFGVQVSF